VSRFALLGAAAKHSSVVLLALATMQMQACDGDTSTTVHEVRSQANAMTRQVNAASDRIKDAGQLIPGLCQVATPTQCAWLHAAYNTASDAVDAAHQAIDFYDDTGLGLVAADLAATGIKTVADKLAADVRETQEAINVVVATATRESRADGGEGSGAGAERAAEAARAAGEGTTPAPDPATSDAGP
jgi:hypothetical protein